MLQPHIPTREPPGPLRIVTSSPVHHVSGVSPQGGGSSAEAHDVNVLSRLHALFHSSNSTTSEDAVQGMARVRSEPVPHGAGLEEMISPLTFEDRKAIKVLVITWNMGDALPKGDLSVLCGVVPQYTASGNPDSLPPLPVEDAHPYHLVVVAGQECPTHSGVPRGLGGGIMKGVHAMHKKGKEEKRKQQDEEVIAGKEANGTAPSEGEKETTTSPIIRQDYAMDSDEKEDEARASQSNTPIPHRHMHPAGPKGWSSMLDEWFCGQPSIVDGQTVLPPSSPNPGESPRDAQPDQSATSLLSPRGGVPPPLIRSASAPGSTSPLTHTTLLPPQASLPSQRSHPTNLVAPTLLHPPLSRSQSSSSASSSSSSEEASYLGLGPPPQFNLQVPSPEVKPKSASVPLGVDSKPAVILQPEEETVPAGGTKCYLHLAKERLMGMYLSVYVYKGCEKLVQGVDKDFVTAGLAGGRLGNKGGIGISVKLANHRFLFINSHLAAHTTRVDARIANIEKIKSELRLDCFLPKEDPRSELEDLTERFDTVFWCGDLNFRLDLTRLHAEWLVEQKKYQEALMWDQLRNVMRDPTQNPLPGFEEHEIDFPPTFKYDVWKSIKTTNRELRRSIRRRGTLDGKITRRPTLTGRSPGSHIAASPAKRDLIHVPENEGLEEVTSDAENPDRPAGVRRNSNETSRTVASRRSFESGGYTSAGPSTVGTDVDDESNDGEEYSTSVDASAYGSRHKALEVAFKEKTKRFLGFVKMDGLLGSSSRKTKLSRNHSKRTREKEVADFDPETRRQSIGSILSVESTPRSPIPRQDGSSRQLSSQAHSKPISVPPRSAITSEAMPRNSISSVMSTTTSGENGYPPNLGLGLGRRGTDASSSNFRATSPNPSITRRFTSLKRSVSGRSTREEARSNEGHDGSSKNGETVIEEEDVDEIVDTREGVYDTSKKQRVPSWCDRVLWKAHVIPDPEDVPAPSMDDSTHDEGHGRPFGRLSHAFANFGGHLKLSMTRTRSIEPDPGDRIHITKSAPPAPPIAPDTMEIVDSPRVSPTILTDSPAGMSNGQVPLPKRPNGLMRHSTNSVKRLTSPMRSRSGSSVPQHPLLDANTALPSPPAYPKITFDPALPSDSDKSHVVSSTSQNSVNGFGSMASRRGRANSDGAQVSLEKVDPFGSVRHSNSSSNVNNVKIADGAVGANGEKVNGFRPRKVSGSSLVRFRSRSKSTESPEVPTPSSPLRATHSTPHNSTASKSPHVQPSHPMEEHPEDRNSFVKFIKELPHWLHVRSSTAGHRDGLHPPETPQSERRRRHQNGEVVCMHYGTIDDVGMRQLEGRSDHRPAIFSAAVYVD